MRVAVIASMKRGLEHFVYRELTSLEKRGMSISLYPTKQATGLYNPKPEWDVHRWRPLGVLAAQPRCFVRAPGTYLRLLREAAAMGAIVDFMLAWYFARTMADASVIYATFGDHKLFVGYFCKRIIGLPLVVTIHAYELYQNPNPRLFRRALAACDQIITVTEYNREILAERYGVDPGRVAVVRITVDTERYRPADKFVILIVAYFVEKKGHDVLFEAVRRLGRDDIEVWVVGDVGPGEPVVDARALAARRGVESQVVFFGASVDRRSKPSTGLATSSACPATTTAWAAPKAFRRPSPRPWLSASRSSVPGTSRSRASSTRSSSMKKTPKDSRSPSTTCTARRRSGHVWGRRTGGSPRSASRSATPTRRRRSSPGSRPALAATRSPLPRPQRQPAPGSNTPSRERASTVNSEESHGRNTSTC